MFNQYVVLNVLNSPKTHFILNSIHFKISSHLSIGITHFICVFNQVIIFSYLYFLVLLPCKMKYVKTTERYFNVKKDKIIIIIFTSFCV